MAVFKNKNWTKRDYEVTNIVACVADAAPNDNYVPADESALENISHIFTQNGVQYYGYL